MRSACGQNMSTSYLINTSANIFKGMGINLVSLRSILGRYEVGRGRLHDDGPAALAQGPRQGPDPRRAGGLRLLGDQRPFPPLLRRVGPLGVRLVDLGGRRPSDRAHSAYELRQLPDRSLPHPAIVARRPRRWRCSPTAFLAGSGRRREPWHTKFS